MEPGSEIKNARGGISVNGRPVGAAVYVERKSGGLIARFTMSGAAGKAALITDCDVYLEKNALITLINSGIPASPLACITPEQYSPAIQVIEGMSAVAPVPEINTNNWKFDVTPERISGWSGGRYWRVNDTGHLVNVVARRDDPVSGQYVWYFSLQAALAASWGTLTSPIEVTLLSNIDLAAADELKVEYGHHVHLLVPEGCRYIIKRTATTTKPVFFVDMGASLALGFPGELPDDTELIIDGGAAWTGSPTQSATTSGSSITSTRPLIYVEGAMNIHGRLRIHPGTVIRNNNRLAGYGSGGGVEVLGRLTMTGGTITRNRAGGGGGGIYFAGDMFSNDIKVISGGSITENDAGLSGGGILLDSQAKIQITIRDGLISGNRARGVSTIGVSPSFMGFGGGIFIPGNSNNVIVNFEGGTIRDNISASGWGNGVAIDNVYANGLTAKLNISGSASLVNNEIFLHYSSGPSFPCVTIAGTLSAPNASIPIRMDSYPSLPGSSVPVLNGAAALVSANYGKFTAPAPYEIKIDGRLYR
jgi:hypothetical protein